MTLNAQNAYAFSRNKTLFAMSATVGLCQFHSFTHLTHNLTCLHTTCDSENPIQKQYKFL